MMMLTIKRIFFITVTSKGIGWNYTSIYNLILLDPTDGSERTPAILPGRSLLPGVFH
jgi:hypothetical protein